MRLFHIGPSLPPLAPSLRSARPDWQQADPARIQRALQRALARPTGGWYALDASRRLKGAPLRFEVNGRSSGAVVRVGMSAGGADAPSTLTEARLASLTPPTRRLSSRKR